jgi:hypothetical protein
MTSCVESDNPSREKELGGAGQDMSPNFFLKISKKGVFAQKLDLCHDMNPLTRTLYLLLIQPHFLGNESLFPFRSSSFDSSS